MPQSGHSARISLTTTFFGRADDQATFRRELRRLYDRIKARHSEGTLLHVFPALPASLAVEGARVDAQVGSSSPPVRQQPIARIHFDL